jgi:hypothetical protein
VGSSGDTKTEKSRRTLELPKQQSMHFGTQEVPTTVAPGGLIDRVIDQWKAA